MAILLSLCGVLVDVGLEPYLPPSWHEMIMGPTLALTQTQFHNLRNRLEDGQGLHPKNVDLEGFFTARRLLGWVRSLDRLQVPRAELETWLVQREPDSIPVGFPDQPSPLVRVPGGVERDRIVPPVESRAAFGDLQEEEEEDEEEGTRQVFQDRSAQRGEEEDEVEDLARIHRRYRTEGGGRPGGSYSHANHREPTPNEVDQTSSSLQECLTLLEETFPFREEQQLNDVGNRGGDLEHQSPYRGPFLPPVIPTGNPSMDMELHWQDLLAIMEPEENGRIVPLQDTDVDIMTSFDHTENLGAAGTCESLGSEVQQQNCNNHFHDITATDEGVRVQGFLEPPSRPALEQDLCLLIPSAELNDDSSDLTIRGTVNSMFNPPDHRDLLVEDDMQLNAEHNLSTFDMNLLKQDLGATLEGSTCLQHPIYPENLCGFDVLSPHTTPPSFTPSPGVNVINQDLLTPLSDVFLVDDEDVEDVHGLSSPLSHLLEDESILDEIRHLDLSLVEGFSPEMVARLEEEGYLEQEIAQPENTRNNDHLPFSVVNTEDQDQPREHFRDSENEADSDSGLSLDFSHSPASPCASETSSYSTSSSSSSSVSTEGSSFSEDEDKDAEEGLVLSDMEVEVIIKQEELEEEDMGAVGGQYLDVDKPLPPNYGDEKLFNGFPWMEHIGHDHTYNQPWPSTSVSSLGKMPTKNQPKSTLRQDNAKPYQCSSSKHTSKTKMWSRDDRRARALKVPFSNELIVNLPVEEFNDLLADCQLSEEQLTLIRDIRRRGKNKIAAQNCRKRKMDVLLGLTDDVSGLRRYRSRLLREKQEAQRNLQEMKRQLGKLYQEVFSRLRDEEGRQLDAMEYLLHFEPDGSVIVASQQQGASGTLSKPIKKQRDKKK